MTFKAHITIMPLTELLDPQGKAVNSSLHNLGLHAIRDVRIGKHIVLTIDSDTREQALDIATTACQRMLCNAVMETYHIDLQSF